MAVEKSTLSPVSSEELEIELPEEEHPVLPENIIIEGEEEESNIAIVPDPIEDFNQNLADVIEKLLERALKWK